MRNLKLAVQGKKSITQEAVSPEERWGHLLSYLPSIMFATKLYDEYLWYGLGEHLIADIDKMIEAQDLNSIAVGEELRRYGWEVKGKNLVNPLDRKGLIDSAKEIGDWAPPKDWIKPK
jgi:hypothetical protein